MFGINLSLNIFMNAIPTGQANRRLYIEYYIVIASVFSSNVFSMKQS